MPVDRSELHQFPSPSLLCGLPLASVVARTAKALVFPRTYGILFRKLMSLCAVSARHLFFDSGRNRLNRMPVSLIFFGTDNLRKSKSALRALDDSISFLSAYLGKIGGAIPYSFNSNPSGRSSVAGLLCGGRPPAVRWLVIPVWVYSIKRMLGRGFLPHVPLKGSEIQPFVTNGYPATSVMLPSLRVRVEASPLHRKPSIIKWGLVFKRHMNLMTEMTIMHKVPQHAIGST